MRNIGYALTAVLAASTLSACATKGYVKRGLEDQRVAMTSTMTAADQQERTERVAGDEALKTDINGVKADLAALRNDLAGLKTDFNARISVVEGQVKFMMPVHFGFDDAAVRSEDQAALERFAQVAAKHYAGANITIEGFADPAGSTSYNKKLSLERADAVKNYLVTKGLDGALLKTIGYGETRLVKTGAKNMDAGAELNRRVTFVIESGATDATVAVLSQQKN
jgi:outer membrane protein OmpA-like peptidoglycan-associated protein